MTPEQEKRAKILMKATLDILNKSYDSFYVVDALSLTAVWDGVECDGHCLKDELEELLIDIEEEV